MHSVKDDILLLCTASTRGKFFLEDKNQVRGSTLLPKELHSPTRVRSSLSLKMQMIQLALVFLSLGTTWASEAPVTEDNKRIELGILQGRLSGIRESSLRGRTIYSFKNIPFAKPPIGPLRFKDPEPAEGWEGIRDASSNPPPCIQQPYQQLLVDKRIVVGEEDCLYLNVFSPQVDMQARLPVMVYIHGGAYFGGGLKVYTPDVILKRDVILVVLQYRLGIFGFMSTEDEVIPGNFGLKDQTMALRWVQQNIAAFGGDPSRVTVFGESAGGSSVELLMLSPEAKGLFQGAIMQSGVALSAWAVGDGHANVAHSIAQTVNCPAVEGSQALLECMQQVSARILTERATDLFQYMVVPLTMTPRVDGSFIPDLPSVLVSSGRFNKVPLMSGVNAHEGGVMTHYAYSSEERRVRIESNITLLAVLTHLRGPTQQEVIDQIRQAFDHFVGGYIFTNDTADLVTQVCSDIAYFIGHDVTSLLHSRHHPMFAYELVHKGQRTFGDAFGTEFAKKWVSHADDLFYLFEGGYFKTLEREDDLALSDIMVALWTNFARTGNPTPDDSLGFKWEMVDERSFKHLVLRLNPVMEHDTREERRKYWLQLPVFSNLKEALRSGSKDEL